jgi:uncharacterized membrane protein
MISLALLFLVAVAGVHADDVIPTSEWTDFGSAASTLNGSPIPPGTVIDAYDNSGVHCGHRISGPTAGLYVAMQVYGDDAETPTVDEGCVMDEHVVFKMNGKVATKLSADDVWRGLGPIKIMDLAIDQTFGLHITGPAGGSGQPGNTVNYDVTVENTGDGTDLVVVTGSSQHGWTVTDPPDPQHIDAGQSKVFQVKVDIPTGALAGTKDTLIVTAQSTFDLGTTDTHKIVTTVGELSGYDLTGSPSGSGEPGDTMDYYFTLENLANSSQLVDITLNSSHGWTIVNPPDPSYLLDPFGSVSPDFGLEIPEDAPIGTKDTLRVMASASKAGDVDTLVIVTSVVLDYGFTITGPTSGIGNPGESKTYSSIKLKNIGGDTDGASMDWTSSNGWTVTGLDSSYPSIASGATVDLEATLEIPGDAPLGTKDTLTIAAASVADPARTDTLRIITTVGHYYAVSVEGPEFGHGEPGLDVPYDVTIFNNGNSYDSILVEVSSHSDWPLSGVPDSVVCFDAISGFIYAITVSIPSGAAPGDQDTLTIVVTSGTESDKTDTLKIVTEVDKPTAVDDDELALPGAFRLDQNYPNPFNMETVISFQIATPGRVTLEIYDILGRKVKTIDAGYLNTGQHQLTWSGASDDQRDVSSGVYFYRLISGEQSLTRKMILLK